MKEVFFFPLAVEGGDWWFNLRSNMYALVTSIDFYMIFTNPVFETVKRMLKIKLLRNFRVFCVTNFCQLERLSYHRN